MSPGPFDLNLRHLRALPAIATHGSVSAAANLVGLSQPALTQGIGKLERQLGVALFDRHANGMTVTADGTALAERAERAIEHLADAMRRTGRGFSRPEQLATATQLKAFLGLADAGGFSSASLASGLTQPAIHRAVRDLEQVCGTSLVERRGRGIVLTPAGRRIARGIRLAAVEIAAGIVTASGDPDESGQMVIGAMPLSRALVVPDAIAAFLTDIPRTQLVIVEGSWRELVVPLRDGVIDIMIGALRDEATPGLEQRPLFEDRLAVMSRAGHPLAGREVDRDALGRQDWIVGQQGTPLRARWEELFEGRPLPSAPIECGSVMVIRGVLAKSDLLALLSPDQVALEIASGMLTVIRTPIPSGLRTIGITVRVGWRPTRAQARMIALLENAARSRRSNESQ